MQLLSKIHRSSLELDQTEAVHIIELVLLDVDPDLLGNLRARHLLLTADGTDQLHIMNFPSMGAAQSQSVTLKACGVKVQVLLF